MIRIFIIGYSANKGGVEAYISNLNDNMDKTKYEIVYSMPEMKIDGKIWRRPVNRHNYLKYRLFWRRFYRENKFDVVYLNTCDIVSIDDLKFAKEAGIPVRIIHSHSSGNQQGIDVKMSLFHRFSEKHSRRVLGKYATLLFACSEVTGNWMYDGRYYKIIKNGINLSKYKFDMEVRHQIRGKHGYQNEKIVGIIGRLVPVKNTFFSLKVLEKAFEMDPTIKAIFIGDGEERTDAELVVRSSGLENRIHFIGAVDNVNEWMSAIDCLLMPSLFEGLPFVLVEAQAAGVPCVVSSAVSEEANLTGLVEYIDLTEDIGVWADKILEACQKKRLDTTQQLIDAGYSITETAKTVSEIIEKSLEKA